MSNPIETNCSKAIVLFIDSNLGGGMKMTNFYVAGHALIQNEKGEYLTLKRSALNDYMPFKWDIPGGTVEAGEKVEEAILREVSEETGLVVKVIRPLYAFSNLSQLPKRQTVQLIYLCELISGTITLNPEEHDDCCWADAEKVRQIDKIAFFDEFASNVLLENK